MHFCTEHLKRLPFLAFAASVDPEAEATVVPNTVVNARTHVTW